MHSHTRIVNYIDTTEVRHFHTLSQLPSGAEGYMKDFADRLREARKAAGLTQEQLGFAVDVTKSSVSAWENNREAPSFKLLHQLRAALGCSLDELICGDSYNYEASENKASDKTNQLIARDPLEASLLAAYRDMNSKQRAALLEIIRKPS